MPFPLKDTIPLALEERQKAGGATHLSPVSFKDLIDTSGTSKTITVLSGKARQGLGPVRFAVKELFDGGATSELLVKAVLNYETTTDVDFVAAFSIHADSVSKVLAAPVPSTPVDASTVDNTYGQQENDVITSLRTKLNAILAGRGVIPSENWTLDLVFTSTGANLSALTQGKLQTFMELIDLSDFDQVV